MVHPSVINVQSMEISRWGPSSVYKILLLRLLLEEYSVHCRSNVIILCEMSWLRIPVPYQSRFNIKPFPLRSRNLFRRRRLKRTWSRLQFCLCAGFVCYLMRMWWDSQFLGTGLPRSCWIILFLADNSRFFCLISHELVESVWNSNPRLRSISR